MAHKNEVGYLYNTSIYIHGLGYDRRCEEARKFSNYSEDELTIEKKFIDDMLCKYSVESVFRHRLAISFFEFIKKDIANLTK